MIFTLKSYSDLGRCSYGTLKDVVDTEKDKIILNGNEVKIEKIEDLFPFLWQSAGCAWHDNVEHKSVSVFYSTGTHWHHDFDDSITATAAKIKRLERNIAKGGKSEKTMQRWQKDHDFLIEHCNSIKRLVKNLDEELEKQKLKLIEENTNK